ncbi:MAG: HAMP domain-containing sensor histidine kinase [Sulfitobacter sp.]
MTHRRDSLLASLLRAFLLPGLIAAVVGLFIVHNLVKEEYDELQDVSLTRTAHLLLNLRENAIDTTDLATLLGFQDEMLDPDDERTLYWFVDAAGQVVAQSTEAALAKLPADMTHGLHSAQGYRFAIVGSKIRGQGAVVVATAMAERNEAITEVLFGVGLGFVLLGLLVAAAAFWAVRKSVGAISDLSKTIAERNEHNLTPLDAQNTFLEVEPAIETLNALMTRLGTAIQAERAFATNAAHELRTPVAISLAQAQRLRDKLDDPELARGASEIEMGLKRLNRLTDRLLQMSRAQSGLGTNPDAQDLSPIISLLMKDLCDQHPAQECLVLKYPSGAWTSRVDPDALGIMLSNLFENAFKYASGDMPIIVDASVPGRVQISNDCAALDRADLETIKQRFVRKTKTTNGFGLGLSIVQDLCRQSGCDLEVLSPQTGRTRGFTAILTLRS